MRDDIYINKVRARLLLLLTAVVLVACSDDSGIIEEETDMLQLVPYTSAMVDFTPSTTRAVALPDGYTAYFGPNSIGVYTTTASDAPDKVRTFSYVNSAWNSQVSVTNTMQYYIYGYMPVNENIHWSISKLTGSTNYADGAKLTFSNLPPVLAGDFSVITGIQQVSSANPEESVSLTAGNFSYTGMASGSNFVCLMLDHLYSCVRFNFKVDDTYSQLRTIKLTKVELKSENQLTYPLVVTFEAGKNCDPSWSAAESYASDYAELLNAEVGKELLLPSVSDTDESHVVVVDGYFAPFDEIANDLVLKCTYDVYDKEGNKTRANCVAENKLPADQIVAGLNQRTTLTLTVNPTYLYVLSDPDLDNPTVVIN